jgi:hypothetical protein
MPTPSFLMKMSITKRIGFVLFVFVVDKPSFLRERR